jgi:hypothetical protein
VFATGGDGFGAAFSRAGEAVAAALAAQRGLADQQWPEGISLRVRMGLHTGEADERDGDYFGAEVNRAARLMAVAHGGQIVCSQATAAYGWRGFGPRVSGRPAGGGRSVRAWLAQAGLGEIGIGGVPGCSGGTGLFVGGLAAFALFGGWGAALVGAVLTAGMPVSWYRGRRQRQLAAASEAWPRLLEELRLLTGAAGRSIPQALFEIGRRAGTSGPRAHLPRTLARQELLDHVAAALEEARHRR